MTKPDGSVCKGFSPVFRHLGSADRSDTYLDWTSVGLTTAVAACCGPACLPQEAAALSRISPRSPAWAVRLSSVAFFRLWRPNPWPRRTR